MRINNKFLKNYYPIETDIRFQYECNFMDRYGCELLTLQVNRSDINKLYKYYNFIYCYYKQDHSLFKRDVHTNIYFICG